MIWMLRDVGTIRHIKEAGASTQSEAGYLWPRSVCKALLDQKRTDYWALMMLPALGFSKCKNCLAWEAKQIERRVR